MRERERLVDRLIRLTVDLSSTKLPGVTRIFFLKLTDFESTFISVAINSTFRTNESVRLGNKNVEMCHKQTPIYANKLVFWVVHYRTHAPTPHRCKHLETFGTLNKSK